MSRSDYDEDYLWLLETGQIDEVKRYERSGCLGCQLWFVALVLMIPVFILKGKFWWVPAILVLIAFVLARLSDRRFFREIYCPKCGYNPTRRRSDGARRKDLGKVRAQLRRYYDCPKCHGEGLDH